MTITTLEPYPNVDPSCTVADMLGEQDSGAYTAATRMAAACHERTDRDMQRAGCVGNTTPLSAGVTEDGTCITVVQLNYAEGSRTLPELPYRVYTWQLGSEPTESTAITQTPKPRKLDHTEGVEGGILRLYIEDPAARRKEVMSLDRATGQLRRDYALATSIVTIAPQRTATGVTHQVLLDSNQVFSFPDARLGRSGRSELKERTGYFYALADAATRRQAQLLNEHLPENPTKAALHDKLSMAFITLGAVSLNDPDGRRVRASLEPLYEQLEQLEHAEKSLRAIAAATEDHVRASGPDILDAETDLIHDPQRAAAVAFAIHGSRNREGVFEPGPLYYLIEAAKSGEQFGNEARERLLTEVHQAAQTALDTYDQDPLEAWKVLEPGKPAKKTAARASSPASKPNPALPTPYATTIAPLVEPILKDVFDAAAGEL